jgi:ABC-type polysaccharide transport system permease subunit
VADLGVQGAHTSQWRDRVYEITSPLLRPMMVTCTLAAIGAVFAPVVGLVWLAAVAAVIAYAGVKAALDRP